MQSKQPLTHCLLLSMLQRDRVKANKSIVYNGPYKSKLHCWIILQQHLVSWPQDMVFCMVRLCAFIKVTEKN